MQHEIEDLECQLQDNMKIVESFDSKQYNTDIGKCILQLQSLDLPCDKMGQIIQTVRSSFQLYLSSNLFGQIFSDFAVLFPFGFSLLLALHY
jgi:isocitrate/isopropylmalate dehydrogenase